MRFELVHIHMHTHKHMHYHHTQTGANKTGRVWYTWHSCMHMHTHTFWERQLCGLIHQNVVYVSRISMFTYAHTCTWINGLSLVGIGNDLPERHLRDIAYFFQSYDVKGLNAQALQKLRDPATLFDILKQEGLISPTNLSKLRAVLDAIGRKDLCSKVDAYLQSVGVGAAAQEEESGGEEHIVLYSTLTQHIIYILYLIHVYVVLLHFPERIHSCEYLHSTKSWSQTRCSVEHWLCLYRKTSRCHYLQHPFM